MGSIYHLVAFGTDRIWCGHSFEAYPATIHYTYNSFRGCKRAVRDMANKLWMSIRHACKDNDQSLYSLMNDL